MSVSPSSNPSDASPARPVHCHLEWLSQVQVQVQAGDKKRKTLHIIHQLDHPSFQPVELDVQLPFVSLIFTSDNWKSVLIDLLNRYM